MEDPATTDWFLPFYTVDAAVGLGLLFLLAGYCVPRSYDRKGGRRSMRECWARIGLPLVVFALGVHLPLVYLFESSPPPGEFIRALYEGAWVALYLHLWFLGHLLLYSAIYVAWRRLAGRTGRPRRACAPPGHAAIVGFVVALALVTWIVRFWYPVDEWVPLLLVLAAEPASMTQVPEPVRPRHRGLPVRLATPDADQNRHRLAGCGSAQRRRRLRPRGAGAVGRRPGHRWGSTGDRSSGQRSRLSSAPGCRWAWWSCSVRFFRRPVRLLSAMANASYAAYILHIWVVVGLQVAILALELPPPVKFALVAVLGTTLTFGLAHLSRHVPGVRVVLGTRPSSPS